MSKGNNNTILLSVFLALGINIMLFALVPLLSRDMPFVPDIESIVPVHMAELKKQPEEEKPQKMPEKKPRDISKPRMVKRPDVPMPAVNLDLPEMDFSVNPSLISGMPVSVPSGVYSIDDVDQGPAVVFRTEPFYPPRARYRGITGRVVVEFVVDEQGHTSDIRVVEADPPGVFEESVIRAVSTWRFSPGTIGGEAVRTSVKIPIDFELNK